MLPLPFTWPYALLFWAVYVWLYVPEFRVVRAVPQEERPAEDRGSFQVVMAGFGVSTLSVFAIALYVPAALLPGDPRVWFFAGVVTLILASLLRRHCFRVLGRFFTGAVTVRDDHRVIDSGAYRYVRHPSYTAALLIIIGLALSFGNWLGLLTSFAIAFPAYLYRARIEEEALLAKLGEPYARFIASRKRFVPFLL